MVGVGFAVAAIMIGVDIAKRPPLDAAAVSDVAVIVRAARPERPFNGVKIEGNRPNNSDAQLRY